MEQEQAKSEESKNELSKEDIEKLKDENKRLTEENKKLIEENKNLKEQIEKLIEENQRLKGEKTENKKDNEKIEEKEKEEKKEEKTEEKEDKEEVKEQKEEKNENNENNEKKDKKMENNEQKEEGKENKKEEDTQKINENKEEKKEEQKKEENTEETKAEIIEEKKEENKEEPKEENKEEAKKEELKKENKEETTSENVEEKKEEPKEENKEEPNKEEQKAENKEETKEENKEVTKVENIEENKEEPKKEESKEENKEEEKKEELKKENKEESSSDHVEDKKEEPKEENKEEKKEETKAENKEETKKEESKEEKKEETKEENKEEPKEENKEQEPKKVDNNDKKEGERKESESKQVEEIVEDSKGFNKESFISQMEGKMEDKYEIIKELGSGAFARCLQVKNKTTGNLYACKEIQKSKMSDLEGFKHEINILIKLDHPNIIKLYEIYETQEYFYLIMELCSGGELFDRIISNIESGKPFTEEQAAEIFHQMMSAINYCHKNNIVHRDLKPENLLLLNQDPKSPIKVIDFGMSKICDPNDIMFERVGSAYYIAPEVLEGMYDEKCDIWSAGVILYILLCGYPCFNGSTDEQIYKQIRKKKYSFPSPEWDAISDDAKNLIKKMLTDAMDRISAEDILKEPWVLERAPNAKKGGVVQLNEGQLKNYANSSKMRKAVLTYIASRLTQSEIDALNKNFQEIDNNNDGKLTLEEIKLAASKNKGINLELIEEIFKSIDTDGSGSIEYTEFISASLDKSLYLQKEKLREAFNLFDVDHSGKISNAEIAKILGMDKRSKEISKILEKYDSNKDGEIDFEEFFEMMKDLS